VFCGVGRRLPCELLEGRNHSARPGKGTAHHKAKDIYIAGTRDVKGATNMSIASKASGWCHPK
jgi:hypothetical protein